jgi:hypothetical protein
MLRKTIEPIQLLVETSGLKPGAYFVLYFSTGSPIGKPCRKETLIVLSAFESVHSLNFLI